MTNSQPGSNCRLAAAAAATTKPNSQKTEQRQAQLQRQQCELDAFRLIEALATLRDHWQPEDVPRVAVEALVEQWHAVTPKADVASSSPEKAAVTITIAGAMREAGYAHGWIEGEVEPRHLHPWPEVAPVDTG